MLDFCIENIDKLMPQEDKFKKALLNQLYERKKQIERNDFYVYQVSFSIDPDSLCLWNYYTKGNGIKGYNLKISTSELAKSIMPNNKYKNKPLKVYHSRVFYTEEDQLPIVKDIIDRFYEYSEREGYDSAIIDYCVDKLVSQGIFFKNLCFQIENEYRIAIYPYISNGQFYSIKDERKVEYKRGLDVPYVDIHFDKKALTGITISPTMDFCDTKETVIAWCKEKGYSNLDLKNSIVKSEIPVRF